MSPGKTRSSKATVNTDEITDFLHSIKDESAEAVLQAILSGNMDAKFSATSVRRITVSFGHVLIRRWFINRIICQLYIMLAKLGITEL